MVNSDDEDRETPMRLNFLLLVFALSACAPTGNTAPAAAPEVVQPAAAAAVEDLIREWSAAGSEGRFEDLKALYANDSAFYWIERGRVAYPDYAAVVAGVDQAASMTAKIQSTV